MADELGELIFTNGIDAETGEPLLPPLPLMLVAEMAKGNPINADVLKELQARNRMLQNEATWGVMAGIDADDLAQAGWGVIFAFEDEARIPAMREALAPLLELRRRQAGNLYRDETTHPSFLYRPGEASSAWLSRNGGAPGQPVDPKDTPYYLLIVGDPAKIPYRFQYLLDVTHAVGRIHFDTLDEYHSYARSVAAVEDPEAPLRRARTAAFFGVHNERDRATALSAEHLVSPLTAAVEGKVTGWQVTRWMDDRASKEQLARLLGGADTPAFLFSASHGLGFGQSGHWRQRQEQGAIVCGDWRGFGPVQDKMRLCGADIGGDARLLGMIAFLFACFGAGTPQFDDFSIGPSQKELEKRGLAVTGLEQLDRAEIAPEPFVAKLPQTMLGHPKGGALAVVGHVDRAWGTSFLWEGAEQMTTFESATTKLLQGSRLGFATEDFNNRYAGLAAELTRRLEDVKFREPVPPEELAGWWTASNDARSYVILGDPAVRLAVGDVGAEVTAEPVIETITLDPSAAPESPAGKEAPAAGAIAAAEEKPAGREQMDFGVVNADALRTALSQFADQLGATLKKAVTDAAELKVSTYVSDDMSRVTEDLEATASLRAYTVIKLDGDITVCVPKQAGAVDRELWAIHLDMVRQAQANRTEMIKAAVAAASGLLDALK